MIKQTKIAILGWADITKQEQEGSGYNLVASELALGLSQLSYRVFYLEAGRRYLPFPFSFIRYLNCWQGIEHYALYNSPNFSPSKENNSSTTWHYDEKIAQVYLLDALQAPVPQCWLFWDYEEALHWAKTAPYPVVFKLSVGASSSHVLKVTNEQEAVQLIKRMFKRGVFPMTMNEYQPKQGLPHSLSQVKALVKRGIKALDYLWTGDYPTLHPMWWKPEYNYAYFQEFLPDNAFDTRVTVIGDRAFAFRRLNRPNDFRASGSGNFDVNPELINQECVKIAFQVSERGNFQSMAYDFLNKNGEPVICEISYTYIDRAVHSCPGHWDKNLNWHEGQMWTEDAIVEDFLNHISSKKYENSSYINL
jgi:hypothetical protein